MDFTTIPPEFNDRFKQGCSYVLPIQILDSNNTPVPLTLATATWTFWDINGNPVITLTETSGLVIQGPQGIITATITATQSALLPAGRLNHSLVIHLFNAQTIEYLTGVMQIDMINSSN